MIVKNIGAGSLTLDPNGAETIDGAATLVLGTGESAVVSSNGTTLRTEARSFGDTASVARTNLGLGTAATQNTGTSGTTVPLLNGANVWSGNQSISKASPSFVINKAASGQDNAIWGQTGGLNRWLLDLGDAISEAGANVGSNLDIYRYDDTGAVIELALQVLRSTGALSLTRLLDLSAATAGQIKFAATQNPSSNVNTLDDYAEITSWTPAFFFGGNNTGMTFSTRGGLAVKIGKLVVASGVCSITAKGSSTGFATIGNLPYTSANTGIGFQFMSVGAYSNMSSITGILSGVLVSNGNSAQLYMGGATTAAALTDTNFGATANIDFATVYMTS